MTGTILVIGATGKTGGHLVDLLVQKGENVRAATRYPHEAQKKFDSRITCVTFDYDNPETFAPALDGVEKIFMMARPGDEQADIVAGPLIQEIKKHGIRRIVNLTAMGVEKREDISLRRVEIMVEDSGIGFTHLRPNFFMQIFNTGSIHADIRATGALHLPAGDGRISFIDVRDIAAVAAVALTESHPVGNAYTLTGGESLNHHQVAEHLSRAAGKTISYIPITDDVARNALLQKGLPAAQTERLINFYRLVRAGWCEEITDHVHTILRHAPITFGEYARDHSQHWL